MSTSQISTHVLDTSAGVPAAGVAVRLSVRVGTGWAPLGEAVTDADGRARELGPTSVAAGVYRLQFDTGAHFAGRGAETFFPEVLVTFHVGDDGRHCHVPLLLSPFGYSTYRGS